MTCVMDVVKSKPDERVEFDDYLLESGNAQQPELDGTECSVTKEIR